MKLTWPKFLTFKKRPKAKQATNSDSEASDDEEISALRNRSVTPFTSPTVATTANRNIPFTPITRSNAYLATDTAVNESSSGQNIYLTPTVSQTSHSRPMTPAMRRLIKESSVSLQPERSGTPYQASMTNRIQCQSLTQKNLPCKNAAVVGSNNCRVHM